MTSERLPRTTAAEVDISPTGLEAFLDAAGDFGGVDSVMVLRHGKIVAERWWPPAAPSEPHVLWSVSKSFTSAAIGLAIDEGLLGLDDRIVDLLPEYMPDAASANLCAMTVRDLLTMTSGHGAESLPDEERELVVDWLQHIFEQPVPFAPGTQFVYNSGATYLLSAILQRRAGVNLLAYLEPRLLEPLGIHGMTTEQSPQGIDCGGWGMFATTEDLALFGQLYLQGGSWEDKQLLPAEWVKASTSHQVATLVEAARPDWSQGYGYLFWQCQHGAFRADGMAGQYIIVIPRLDLVVAMTANLNDMQAELDLVWKLLPAIS